MAPFPSPPARRRDASGWLFGAIFLALSAGAWWLLSRPAGEGPTAPGPAGAFVPEYDPALGRAVARWQPDWPASTPVPTTPAVMARALAEAVAAEEAGGNRPPEVADAPDPVARAAPPAPLAALRRACADATRRGRDPERVCDRFADASRPTLPAPVVRPSGGFASEISPAPVPDGRAEEALIRHWMRTDNCDALARGSIAWRECRVRYREFLAAECVRRTQDQLAIAARPSDAERRDTRALCTASRRYQPLDN